LIRLWKWHILGKYLHIVRDFPVNITGGEVQVSSLVDVGCGDLSFWKGKTCMLYTGIDFSETQCKENSKARKAWQFICSGAEVTQPIKKAEAVFCFDLLFHIVNETSYLMTLKNLTEYSDRYIFVYTWFKNPIGFPEENAETYQKFRDFTEYQFMFERKGFELVGFHKCPDVVDKFGAMWVFKKSTRQNRVNAALDKLQGKN